MATQSRRVAPELVGTRDQVFTIELRARRYGMTMRQRDLEDQIAEELQQRQNQIQMIEQTARAEEPRMSGTMPRPQVKVTEIQDLLRKGYTRYEKDNKGYGSIQGKFNLSGSQVKEIFLHEGLKGLKTKIPGLEIIDDRPAASQGVDTQAPSTTSLFD